MLMGTSDLVPGISGGTIAVVLGIYERLIQAISGIFSREWKSYIGFFIPLLIGVGLSFILLSRLIDYLYTNHEGPMMFFFLGLIIGVIPYLFKKADFKETFKGKHYLFMGVGVIIVASINMLQAGEPEAWTGSLTTAQFLGLFFSGWLASMAMLLPGISGSFLLLIIGVYPTVIRALSEFQLSLVFVVGAGVAVGAIVSGKAIHYIFNQFPHMTYAFIIGLVFGSVFVLYPGLTFDLTLIVSVLTFAAGLLAAYLLGRLEHA
nr:DUF368 domain-containing protein [Pontibacillus halophilus]